MRDIELKYIKTSDIDLPFDVPSTTKQRSNDIFSKADCFGFTLNLPLNLCIDKYTAWLREDDEQSIQNQFKPDKFGGFTIPLGFRIVPPPGIALLHINLLGGKDYVVDGSVYLENNSYSVNLYMPAKLGLHKKDIPAMKIIPITDDDYNFTYKRVF